MGDIDIVTRRAEYIARRVDLRSDGQARGHSWRTAGIMQALVVELQASDEDAYLWPLAMLVHDIGKLWMPEEILRHPGPLTPEQTREMWSHPAHGRDALLGLVARHPAEAHAWQVAAAIAVGHHERPDGLGYPRGLHGEAVPLVLQLARAVDVYDALVSDRAYHRGRLPAEALRTMRQMGGFAPDHLDALAAIAAWRGGGAGRPPETPDPTAAD